jgi:hypothetical protein
MTCTIRRMHGTFVPDRWRPVTSVWIDHSALRIGPKPFVTTKTVSAVHAGMDAANAQIVVTNADPL